MKNLFKQKSLKVCAISIVVSSMALVGYNAYSNATMTPEERLFQQNLEALTSGEEGEPTCIEGGIGSLSCSIEAGIEILGSGVTYGCSVSCDHGYYACCSLRCVCEENN